jgi:hypothetical protein
VLCWLQTSFEDKDTGQMMSAVDCYFQCQVGSTAAEQHPAWQTWHATAGDAHKQHCTAANCIAELAVPNINMYSRGWRDSAFGVYQVQLGL